MPEADQPQAGALACAISNIYLGHIWGQAMVNQYLAIIPSILVYHSLTPI